MKPGGALYCRRKFVLWGGILSGFVGAQSAFAETKGCVGDGCFAGLRGAIPDQREGQSLPMRKSAEPEKAQKANPLPFSIRVENETITQDGTVEKDAPPSMEPPALPTPRDGLHGADIQIKYDGLDIKPALNVSTDTMRRSFRAGENIRFLSYANYPAFIDRAEVRIYEKNDDRGVEKPLAIVPIPINGTADWSMPATRDIDEYRYALRVYDAEGRYDETSPLTLSRTEREAKAEPVGESVAPGTGEDRTAFRNIHVRGGSVTVYGRDVPDGYSVEAFSDIIPIDASRDFVVQRILPPGEQQIDVALDSVSGTDGLRIDRTITIPDDDWFFVALGDLTTGKRTGDRNIETVRPGEYDEVYTDGRLAFYLKGKIRGEYLLTAAADTGGDDIESIFRNLDSRDPRRLLRRINPNDYYPVYGDDSSMIEDAPTNGKFYVRVEHGDSHVMWGNYKTQVTGTEFLRQDRGLYGARGVYRSEDSTSFGERRTESSFYAAQPDTLPQRELFLGTGGTAYFMKRQNIIEGSETVIVEIRDETTGRVIERKTLGYGEDYSFNYLQGTLILRRPLSSTTGTDETVRNGALGGNKVYLSVQYEYELVARDLDGYMYGGRVQQWLNDAVRVGVTGMNENTGLADQQSYGADIQLRQSETTFLKAEVAQSKGPGFSTLTSTDGGLTSSDSGVVGSRDQNATAWRLEGQTDLKDAFDSGMKGIVGGYIERKQRGFSSLNDQVSADRRIMGAHAKVDLTDTVDVRLTYDDYSDNAAQTQRDGVSSVGWQVTEDWKVSLGGRYAELHSPLAIQSGKKGYDGTRFDSGVRVDHRWSDDMQLYAFGQGTAKRSGDIDRNDRAGVGSKWKMTDTIGLEGEVSYGTNGLGSLAGVTYDPTVDDHYYVGYRLDPDRAFALDRNNTLHGRDKGTLVTGIKHRVNDVTTTYAENNYDMFGQRRSLTQTHGVVYTPNNVWSVDGGFEAGRIRDDTLNSYGAQRSDFDRYAPSVSVRYKDESTGVSARVRGEMRIENSKDGSRNQNTYVLSTGLAWKTNPDWRLLTNLDAVISDAQSVNTSFQDTRYVEGSLGYAYRPVDNDRLAMLFKYGWLYDLPGNDQLISGSVDDMLAPAQSSHILSADMTYDLLPWLSIGGKYGFRYGEVRYDSGAELGSAFEDWQTSTAHLGVIRTDLHIVKEWDILLEGRVLYMPEADTTDYGVVAAVYRHIDDNIKIGIGYNFGVFSDDLRDLTLNDRGVFFNIVAKF